MTCVHELALTRMGKFLLLSTRDRWRNTTYQGTWWYFFFFLSYSMLLFFFLFFPFHKRFAHYRFLFYSLFSPFFSPGQHHKTWIYLWKGERKNLEEVVGWSQPMKVMIMFITVFFSLSLSFFLNHVTENRRGWAYGVLSRWWQRWRDLRV